MMSHSNYKNRKTLQLKEVSFMGASFLCGLIRIPDFVQNLFLNKKSYRLYIGIIYSSQKRREAVKLSYNRKRIKANKMMTGKNVMNSGIEQKINHAMEGMQKELQQKSWSRLEKFSKPESIKIYEEHLFSALNSMENEKLEELFAEMDQYVNFFIMGFFTKDMFTDIDVILPWSIGRSYVLEESEESAFSTDKIPWFNVLGCKYVEYLHRTQSYDIVLELYKTYYKKEYKQLRRFKTLDINDLEALTEYSFQDCESTGEYIYASICYSRLIYIAKYVLKIELNTSVLISLKMIKDIYDGIEWEEMNYPDWDAIPEGELIHKCLEATNALGMGDSLYDHFDEKEIPEIEDDTERLRKELEIVLIQFGLIIRKMDSITDGLLHKSDQYSEKAKGSHADSKQKKRDSNSKNAPQPSHDQVTEQEEEIQELKKKLAKTEQDAAYLGELYEAEKKKNSETAERLETAETEHLELIKLREEMYRMTEAAPESVANTSMEEKEKVLSCYKIAIIGGHDNWTYKLKNKFKNWKFYRPEVTRTIDEKSLQTADYIYFFTDIMSHGSYCRYIKFVREYGLKFGYLHTINIESNINQIYEDIQNLEK